MQKCPGRPGQIGKDRCPGRRNAPAPQPTRRQRRHRPAIVGRARQHRNFCCARDIRPAAPAWQLHQIVRSHQPDEAHTRKTPPQRPQRIARVASPERPLDVGRDNAPTVRKPLGRRQPHRQRRHACCWLERITRRYEQPYLVQPQMPQCEVRDMLVAGVGGIEAAAEQADAQPRSVAPARDGQGREECSFLKKRTKKLLLLGIRGPVSRTPMGKRVLLLFFKKEDLSLLSDSGWTP